VNTRCDSWARALWEHYLPSVSGGAPFYLAADSRLIRHIYSTQLATSGELETALGDFNQSCGELLAATTYGVAIRSEAFQRLAGNSFSRAICLAVQQVLVVERMLNDQQYSEHSYFPRYREVLGVVGLEHSSPISTEVFRKVWEVLAEELRSVSGASERTVTFAAGRGRDRNRAFPMSQALFTTHDLTVVREECPTLYGQEDDRVLVTALLQVRQELGTRARRLLAAAAADQVVASRICGQVRAFLESDVLSSLRRARHLSSETGCLVAYLERADAFDLEVEDDTFAVYFRTGGEMASVDVSEAAIEGRLARAPVIFLAPDADGFREWSQADSLDADDCVLALVYASKAHLLRTRVADSYRATFLPTKSNLPNRYSLLVCTHGLAPHLSALLGMDEHRARLELVGGLLADARSRVFLAGYPPIAIRYEGTLLNADEQITVGGIRRRVDEFLGGLRHQTDSVRYTLQVSDSVATLSISAEKAGAWPGTENLGYALREGELELVARPVSASEPSLRGTCFSIEAHQQGRGLSDVDLATLIGRGRRIAMANADLSLILDELRPLEKKSQAARLAVQQIATTRSIPLRAATSGLLRRLHSAGDDVHENKTPGGLR
jgi:hypothetical protein